MKLYLLRRLSSSKAIYDCYDAKLIRAKDSVQARKIANEETADEGRIWEDKALVSCRRVLEQGLPQVIITDFHAG